MALLILPPAIVHSAPVLPPGLSPTTIQNYLDKPLTPPQFPNMTDNYAQTVVIPAQQAAEQAQEAQAQQLAVQQAQAVYTAPPAPSGTLSEWMAEAGITDRVAFSVIMRESGGNPNAVNASSGACGLGQQLPCGKWSHTWNDPVGALIDAQAYVYSTYGSWENAWASEQNRGWY